MTNWHSELLSKGHPSTVIQALDRWHSLYELEAVTDIGPDGFRVRFKRLPEPLEDLVYEIAELCPDIVYQGYGVIDEMVESYEEMGQVLPERYASLVKGVDLTAENYWVELMKRDLKHSKEMVFWWD